ncbi:MAG TPA: methyltransferase domain-containing protein [Candidatus Binataceae bacterium]
MASSIKRAFDTGAENYDRGRRRLVPGFDDFYRAATDLIPFSPEREFTVLDLGAGTGLLSAFIAYSFPRARITMVDISDEMLAVARERFAPGGERFTFEIADYGEGHITGRYDAIVSALSIHHLTDAKKQMIYAQAFASLNEGGVLVNADQVRGESDATERRNHELWLQRVRQLGVGERDLAEALERMKYDRCAPLSAQLGWLRQAGFRDVDCAYQNLIFAVYSGIR